METLTKRILTELESKGIDPQSNPGRTWLLSKMRKLNPTSKDRMEIIRDREAQRTRTMIGRFYFFFYHPKTHETLPYWDRFPMVIPLTRYHDGFLGLNLHYIYPKDRLVLLKQLGRFATGARNDERTRLRLSYPLLKAMHQAYRATPCVKRYLTQHIQSRAIEIPPQEWDIAATLPVQSFQSHTNVSPQEVWEESKGKY